MTTKNLNNKYRFSSSIFRLTNPAFKATTKGVEKVFSWIGTDHHGATQQTNLIAILQTINFHVARLNLMERRMARVNAYFEMYRATAIKVRRSKKALDWLLDNLIFLLEVIWGAIKPIITSFYQLLLRLAFIVICNCIYFYALYLLFTSDTRH